VEVDASVYEALRAWRVTEAKRRRVPAYVIFPDRTLEAIAANPPGTLAALGEIPGIGPAKLHSHGRSIMAVLKRLTG
jgi:ATP-dependent DNA helicase RecQ